MQPLLAHLVQVHSQDLSRLRSHDVTIAHCPKSNAKFGHGIAPVKDFTNEGFIVGIGTDIVECVRIARMIEFDPLYVDTIVRRFQRTTGKDATLASDGRTFAAVEYDPDDIA